MLTAEIIRVETIHSKKNNKEYKLAWFLGDKGLPCKAFAPDDIHEGQTYNIFVIPDFRCNASFEFELVK